MYHFTAFKFFDLKQYVAHTTYKLFLFGLFTIVEIANNYFQFEKLAKTNFHTTSQLVSFNCYQNLIYSFSQQLIDWSMQVSFLIFRLFTYHASISVVGVMKVKLNVPKPTAKCTVIKTPCEHRVWLTDTLFFPFGSQTKIVITHHQLLPYHYPPDCDIFPILF